jgi:crotonobetainyl-CoA:carnitine CoA-transferase CaiB-like acyl-CoA transferase
MVNPDARVRADDRLGSDGPWSGMAGHDIDYLALSGMLHAIGPAERPVPPLNLAADYGGGGMMLIAGVLAGVMAARAPGGADAWSTPRWWKERRTSVLSRTP